jgi:hypothetical protein
MSGELFLRKTSSGFLGRLDLTWYEAFLLLGSGALAVALHHALRLPLSLPGRHGIEWMALLILGRASSRFNGAGSLASAGAAVTAILPIWGHNDDPYIWLIYLLPGLLMDLVFWRLPAIVAKPWFLVILGGMAHITKPLARLCISLANGWAYGSFRYGVAYPFVSHLLFGMVGALFGVLILRGIQRFEKNDR